MYWFPLPFQLPVMIWPVQCWKQHKTPNKERKKYPSYLTYMTFYLYILSTILDLYGLLSKYHPQYLIYMTFYLNIITILDLYDLLYLNNIRHTWPKYLGIKKIIFKNFPASLTLDIFFLISLRPQTSAIFCKIFQQLVNISLKVMNESSWTFYMSLKPHERRKWLPYLGKVRIKFWIQKNPWSFRSLHSTSSLVWIFYYPTEKDKIFLLNVYKK